MLELLSRKAFELMVFDLEVSEIEAFAKVELGLGAKTKGDKLVFKGENIKMSIKHVAPATEHREPLFKIKLKYTCNDGSIIKDKRIASLTQLSDKFKWMAIENLKLDADAIFS